MLAALRRETTNPNEHRQPALVAHGVSRTIPTAGRPTARSNRCRPSRADDLQDLCAAACSRATTSRSPSVGDIDAATLGPAARPACSARCRPRRSCAPVPDARSQRRRPRASWSSSTCRRRWSASAAPGIARKDPDFMPAYSSTTSSAAARSPRGSTTRCARSAASPMASIPICCRCDARRAVHRRHRRPAPTAPARRSS